MAHREYNLHDGKKGAAIGVRVTPRARKDEIAEINEKLDALELIA